MVKYYDFDVMIEKAAIRYEPFNLFYNGWYVDYPDPATYFEGPLDPDLRASGNSNNSYFKNARVSARIEAAGRLSCAARRKALSASTPI